MSDSTKFLRLPPELGQTTDKLPANCGWDLEAEWCKGRPLEEIRAIAGGATLLRFGSRPNLLEPLQTEPPLYLGLRPALRVDGDMGVPQVAVYTFPDGVSEESLSATLLLAPSPSSTPEVRELIGLFCTGVYRNNQPGCPIPPALIGSGFWFEFGEIFMEVNTMGVLVHKPKIPGIVM